MTPDEISEQLSEKFSNAVEQLAPGSWQVDTSDFRLLVLLSDDESWLRVLIPIAPAQDAQPFFEQLLEANFEETQAIRYALQQNVLWAVFHHNTVSLTTLDFTDAVQHLIDLRYKGLDDCFNRFVETRVRQIIRVSKQQGQSLEATMQTLERFYQEGLMGDMEAGAKAREETLAAWQFQLQRLWHEAE